LPATLSGATVDVQAGGQTYAVPPGFVSPTRIDCQLPYQARTEMQVRVRNSAETPFRVPAAPSVVGCALAERCPAARVRFAAPGAGLPVPPARRSARG
jgi:uncharacterized protein (TIGR03437 family)